MSSFGNWKDFNGVDERPRVTWAEIRDMRNTDWEACMDNDDWGGPTDVYDDNWRGRAEVANLPNEELLVALRDLIGCACCASAAASDCSGNILEQIKRRLK